MKQIIHNRLSISYRKNFKDFMLNLTVVEGRKNV